jgi:Spy/CpxP family protein refolding chaperone
MMKKFLLVVMAAVLLTAGAAFAEKKGDDPAKDKPSMEQVQKPGQGCLMKGNAGPGMGPLAGHMGMSMGLQMKLKFALDNPELKKELNLTADQESKLNAIQVDLEKTGIQKRADIQLLNVDLEQEFKKDSVDVKKVQDLADKIAAAGADLFKKNITATAEIMNILTKEQRTKLEAMRAEQRQMMMKKFKKARR